MAQVQDNLEEEGYEVVSIGARAVPAQPQGVDTRVDYELYSRASGAVIDTFPARNDDEAITRLSDYINFGAGQSSPDNFDVRRAPIAGSTLDLQRQRAAAGADAAQGGIIDVDIDLEPAPPPAPQPAGMAQWNGQWRVLVGGREVYRFGGIGNSQADANRIAAAWLRSSGQGVSGEGFEVYPVMNEHNLEEDVRSALATAALAGTMAMAENKAAGINKMFNNLGDPVYANLQRVALLAMQGRQQEAAGRLQTVIKHADPAVQKKITDAVNSIKPVTINGRVADSSTLDKSQQHNDWITNKFIPWVQSLLGQQGVAEARKNPDQNKKYGMGKYELAAFAEDIRDQENWGVSMTAEPKLGINPQVGISEDTPKGIYFYPLEYFIQMVNRYQPLPWGDNMPYMQLFQYDRSNEMTQQTQVDPAQLRQALSQYCPEKIIQQVLDEPDSLYDDTPYWMIYDCLSRLGTNDETNVVRWNKVLRDLGFTCVFDPGAGWIAYGEPTQGVVLDPRIIQQHKMFVNRNPKVKARQYDVQELADAIMYNGDYNRERQRQRIRYGDPAEVKARLDVAKSMLRQFLGKTNIEAKEMGFDQAVKTAGEKVIEILTQNAVQENFADGRHPEDKGDSARHGIPKKATMAELEKASHAKGRKGQLARWQLNMRRGHKK